MEMGEAPDGTSLTSKATGPLVRLSPELSLEQEVKKPRFTQVIETTLKNENKGEPK